MIRFIKNQLYKLLNLEDIIKKQIDLKTLVGINLLETRNDSEKINDNELKIFSQFGEDGIINYLINKIEIKNKTFVEFGVEDYEEANTRFLLEARNWKGLIFDSSEKNIKKIKKKDYYWRYNLIAKTEFITAENINQLIQNTFNNEEIDLMSIDVDGNDYWIWKALEVTSPKIIVIEYNARFGPVDSVVVPYNKNFNRNLAHHSSVYFGASLQALYKLGMIKNYSLVATNLNGNNAFFVKNSEIEKTNIQKTTPKECFNINSFNELRNKSGKIIERNIEEEKKILNKLPLDKV